MLSIVIYLGLFRRFVDVKSSSLFKGISKFKRIHWIRNETSGLSELVIQVMELMHIKVELFLRLIWDMKRSELLWNVKWYSGTFDSYSTFYVLASVHIMRKFSDTLLHICVNVNADFVNAVLMLHITSYKIGYDDGMERKSMPAKCSFVLFARNSLSVRVERVHTSDIQLSTWMHLNTWFFNLSKHMKYIKSFVISHTNENSHDIRNIKQTIHLCLYESVCNWHLKYVYWIILSQTQTSIFIFTF